MNTTSVFVKALCHLKLLAQVVFITVILFAAASNVVADDIWTFTGTITSGLAGSPYTTGSLYSVSFEIDTNLLSPAAPGLYYPIVAYGFDADSSGFGASSTGSGVYLVNDQPLSGGGSFDGIIFGMFSEPETGFPSGVQFNGSAFGITLVNTSSGPTATPFTGTSFPATLNLGDFSQESMTVYFQSGDVTGTVQDLYINGNLISEAPVPEPNVIGLFVMGGLLLAGQSLAASRGRNPLRGS